MASGAHKQRVRMLDAEALGVPVIAMGVPTVVDAATLINDTMDLFLESIRNSQAESNEFFQMLSELDSDDKYGLIQSILDPYKGSYRSGTLPRSTDCGCRSGFG